jgi:hypothetical protein
LDDGTRHVFFRDQVVFIDQIVIVARLNKTVQIVAEVHKAHAEWLGGSRLRLVPLPV